MVGIGNNCFGLQRSGSFFHIGMKQTHSALKLFFGKGVNGKNNFLSHFYLARRLFR